MVTVKKVIVTGMGEELLEFARRCSDRGLLVANFQVELRKQTFAL